MGDTEFYGRNGELEILQDAYESNHAEMAIIYGRRRVGKTALIQKFCEAKKSLERLLPVGTVFTGCRRILQQRPTTLP